MDHIHRTLALLTPDSKILDVGAGGRRITPAVVTVDAAELPGIDIVGDIHDLPIPDDQFDCVFCTGTLEHVHDPWKAIREICRVAKPGGIVHIDVPFIQGFHADPNDYWRFTKEGLRLLCRDFEELECGVHIGPSCGLVWIAREWADSLSTNRYLSNLLLAAAAVLMAPLRYFDYFTLAGAKSHRVASAVYFRGRKPVKTGMAGG